MNPTITLLSFEQLSKEDQDAIVSMTFAELANFMLETDGKFIPEFDREWNTACKEAERRQTPWFIWSIFLEKNSAAFEVYVKNVCLNGWYVPSFVEERQVVLIP